MKKYIPSIALTFATVACGNAIAANDHCQDLKDQFAQSCTSPQTNSKWGAALMGTACVIAAQAIQKCERRANDQANDDDDEDNDDQEK